MMTPHGIGAGHLTPVRVAAGMRDPVGMLNGLRRVLLLNVMDGGATSIG